MSRRELRALGVQTDSTSDSRTLLTRSKSKMENVEAEELKRRVQEVERELAQTREDKEAETQQLRTEAEDALASLESEQQRSAKLQQELRDTALQAEIDKHRALDYLREEHQRALEREQRLVEEEKKRNDLWVTDLKSGFGTERLEKNLPTRGEIEVSSRKSDHACVAGRRAHGHEFEFECRLRLGWKVD